ncbi:MAG TPA: DUF2007 domain-containing protein [Parvularculaceae bacterium]|nr:DUF2007 domain-containing protein [Parvularculaceae bacterium]
MRLVYTAPNAAEIHIRKGVLEKNGIACITKNEALQGAVGDLAAVATWPELWILNDAQEAAALRILKTPGRFEFQRIRRCSECGAEIDGPFDACWNCGAALVG